LQVAEIPQGHRVEYLARSSEDKDKFYLVHAPHLTEENVGQIKDYYVIDCLGYERMFRFQVEDSDGYISKDHVIYTNIPLEGNCF